MLHKAWIEVMKASYGDDFSDMVSSAQRADMKRMFMAGAVVAMGCTTDNQFAAMVDELDKFGSQAEDDNAVLQGD